MRIPLGWREKESRSSKIPRNSTIAPGSSSSHRLLILEERKKNYIYYQLNTSVFEEIMMWIAQFSNQQEKPDAAKPDEPDGRA